MKIKNMERNKSKSLENCYSGVFGVADYESDVSFPNFKMADPIWRMTFLKNNEICLKLFTREVFGVAKNEYDIGFPKFKMADPIWLDSFL